VIAGRPITRRAWAAAIEARATRWSAWLLPARRIHWPPIAASSLLGSAGKHPALASFRHLAPGQVGVAAEGVETTCATTPSAASGSTARSPATTGSTARSPATTGSTAWAAPTAAAVPIAATATTTPIIATRIRIAPRFGPRHHVQYVVKIALLLGVGRRLVARKDAYQAHPGGALAGHRECLHQTRQAIALDVHRRGHGLSLGACAKVRRCGFDGRLGRGIIGRFTASAGLG